MGRNKSRRRRWRLAVYPLKRLEARGLTQLTPAPLMNRKPALAGDSAWPLLHQVSLRAWPAATLMLSVRS